MGDVINRASVGITRVGVALALLSLSSCTTDAPSAATEGEAKPPAEASSTPPPVSVEPKLVPLPDFDLNAFPAEVADQFRPLYEQAVATPDDARAVGSFGMLLHAQLLREKAKQCYERARALEPKEPRWIYYHAIVSDELGNRPLAAALVKLTTELDPHYAPGLVRLAGMLLETGELEESESNYRKATEADPKLASAHLGLGRVLAARAEWGGAVEAYRRATQLQDGYAAAYYALSVALQQAGEANMAKDARLRYEQVRDMKAPSFDPVYDDIAAMLGAEQAPEAPSLDIPESGLRKVVAELEAALKEQPMMLSAHTTLIAVYSELNETEQARKHYLAALKIDPKDPMVHYNWGVFQMVRGNLHEAAEAFEAALKIKPQYPDALVQYGLIQERSGAVDAAAQNYRIALRTNPDHRRAHFHLGIILFKQGQEKEGLRHFIETTKIQDRETPRFLLLVARTYARMGDRQQTEQYLGKAHEMATGLGLREFLNQLEQERATLLAGGLAR